MMSTPMQMPMAPQQQVPNQSQQPLQAQQQPPSQTQQASQIPQNQQYLSAHSQADQNQRNGLKQREQSLFNSYVYDFLKRSGATETARTYLREGDIKLKNDNANSINGNGTSSDNDTQLPDAEVPVQAPEGFLYEWWTVFWDIYSAKLNRPGTMEAQRYVATELRNRVPNRMHTLGQIPMTYQHPVVQQQQQLRLLQQHPQHQQQQAQQVSQQAAQQQQQQQQQQPPPQPQPPQPPQQPQPTQQPQPQPSPANHQHQQPHQPQQFNNNRILDANNSNGGMLSPQRPNVKVTPQAVPRRPINNMNNMALVMRQQQQQQLHSVQNTQIQNQVQQQQNPGVNQGQVQQQPSIHMNPNQTQAQLNPGLNPGTKRSVEGPVISQNMNQQSTSPTKRARISEGSQYSVAAQVNSRIQQQPNQQGQIPQINQNLMLTTPVNGVSASPDLSTKRPQPIANGKVKGSNQQLQLARPQQQQQQQQVTPMNNKSITQQINPMVTNQMHNDAEIANQINNVISTASAANENLNNIFPGAVRAMQRSNYFPGNIINQRLNNKNMIIEPQPNMAAFKQHEIMRQQAAPLNLQQLAYLQQHQHQQFQQVQVAQAHAAQAAQAHAAVGQNNNSAQHQQRVKNDVKGTKNSAKTTPTQGQAQIPNGNQSNAIATPQQQQVAVTNGVQSQSQQPAQTTATTDVTPQDVTSSSLQINIEEVMNYQFDMDANFDMLDDTGAFDVTEYLNLDEFGSSNNAGPSASTTNGN